MNVETAAPAPISSAPSPSREVQIPAKDGFPLSATLYGEPSQRLVVLNSATSVARGFYRSFASALTKAGFRVLTYDYRGVGDSRPSSLRGFQARTRDWGLLDMEGVLAWARHELVPSRIFLVGHSVGGQLAGLLEVKDGIDGMVTLSSQSGYWGLQGGEQKLAVAVHVHLTVPATSHLFGYFPFSRLAQGEDLPKGAALEWARWCRNPDYLRGDSTLPLERFQDFEAPVLAYSIDDDKWGTAASVDAMMSAYPNLERRHIHPKAHGLRGLGHFGYFRPSSRALWSEAIEWMEALSSERREEDRPAGGRTKDAP